VIEALGTTLTDLSQYQEAEQLKAHSVELTQRMEKQTRSHAQQQTETEKRICQDKLYAIDWPRFIGQLLDEIDKEESAEPVIYRRQSSRECETAKQSAGHDEEAPHLVSSFIIQEKKSRYKWKKVVEHDSDTESSRGPRDVSISTDRVNIIAGEEVDVSNNCIIA
jgi:hypothetical protein